MVGPATEIGRGIKKPTRATSRVCIWTASQCTIRSNYKEITIKQNSAI